MLGIEAVVMEVFRLVADDSRAVSLLRIDRISMSAAVRDGIADELGRRVQFFMFIEVDRVVVIAAVNLSGPGLSHRIVPNDYSRRSSAVFSIRVEIDPVSAGAFERETVDDDVTFLVRVRRRVHPVYPHRRLDRVLRGIGAVRQPQVQIRGSRIPIPASGGHRSRRTQSGLRTRLPRQAACARQTPARAAIDVNVVGLRAARVINRRVVRDPSLDDIAATDERRRAAAISRESDGTTRRPAVLRFQGLAPYFGAPKINRVPGGERYRINFSDRKPRTGGT